MADGKIVTSCWCTREGYPNTFFSTWNLLDGKVTWGDFLQSVQDANGHKLLAVRDMYKKLVPWQPTDTLADIADGVFVLHLNLHYGPLAEMQHPRAELTDSYQ